MKNWGEMERKKEKKKKERMTDLVEGVLLNKQLKERYKNATKG